jgi:hypothetical protein
LISPTQDECEKLAGLIKSHICLSLILNELLVCDKCIK